MKKADDLKGAFDQHAAGVDSGTKIAKIAIGQYPDGFSNEIGDGIRGHIEEILATALDALREVGVKRRHREHFEVGYYVGIRSTIDNYVDDCRARAMKASV